MRHTFPRSEHLKSRKIIDRLFARDKSGTLPGKKGNMPPVAPAPPAEGAPLTVYAYPFRVLYFRRDPINVPGLPTAGSGTLPLCQVLISVPKRAFKKAVDRNAVRRRVSEAYRLQKHRLVARSGNAPPAEQVAQIVFLYTAKTKISFEEIEKGMKLALKKIK